MLIIINDFELIFRSDESVWNSYAARNLRSMRYGSYSEDSDESDSHGHKGSDRTSTETRKDHSIPEVSLKQELEEDAARSNSETSFYSYHSDDENENIERMQIQEQKNRGRKRSFVCVEKSPYLRRLSQKSELTQEINILSLYGDEHRLKRSNSEPSDFLGCSKMRQCESDSSNYRDFAGFTGEHLQSSSFINKEENCDKTKCFKNRHDSPTRGLEDMHIMDQNMQMNMSDKPTCDLHTNSDEESSNSTSEVRLTHITENISSNGY